MTATSGTDWRGAGTAGGIAAAVYGASMCREVYWGDSAELSLRAASLELSPIARGYPLHRALSFALGKLAGDPALGTNIASVLAAAVTVALLFEAGRRLGGGSRLAGTVAAGVGGLAHTVWFFAGIAEVYALHGAFLAAILLLTLGAVDGTIRTRWSLGLLLSLSLLHHRMIAFALPGILVHLLCGLRGRVPGDRAHRIEDVAWGAALGIVPFAILCFVASRAPPQGAVHGTAEAIGWWFRDVFMGGDANAEHVLGSGRKPLGENALYVARWIAFNLPGPALVLAAVGLVRLWRTSRDKFLLFALLIPAHLVFPLRYDWTGDQFSFLSPLYPILALLAAAGVTAIGHAPSRRACALAAVAAPPLLYIALAFTAAGPFVFPGKTDVQRVRLALPSHSDEHPARDRGRPVLAALPQGAMLHCDWGDGQVYRYLQAVEGLRPDVRVRIWYGKLRPLGGGADEWVSVLPGRTPLPNAVLPVADRLEPHGAGIHRLLPETPR